MAQTTAARPDRGILPGASYSVSEIENISLTNGNVQLTVPLASLPPMAGGKLKYTLNAVYNSKLWNVTRQENRLGQFYGCPSWVVDTPQLSDLGGWRIPLGYQIVFRNAHEDFDYAVPAPPPTADCESDVQEQQRLQSQYYRVILIGPDGAEHELRPTDNYTPYSGSRSYLLNYYKDIPNTVGGGMRYYSYDGSYLYAVINPSSSLTSWTVYMNDGTRIVQYSNGIQRITDTNGNSIKIFSDANGGHIQDELTTREVRLYNNQVFYKTVTGIEQTINIVMGSTLVQGKLYQVNDWSQTGGETGGGFVCTRNEILQTSVPVIREIVFPVTEPGVSARRYSFSYNSDTTTANVTDNMRLSCGMPSQPYTRTVSNGMGELSQVVTPSGATVKYFYSKSSINNFSLDANDIPRATVTQKQLVHDGVTDTWSYDITEFNGCGGIVNAPDGSVNIEQCYPHDPAWARFFGYADDRGGLTYRSRRSDKELVERHWAMLPFTGANANLTGNFGVTTFNPVVDVEYLTLLDDTANHNPIKMSAKKFQYDFNGNLTQQIDYDWFDPALVSRGIDGVPTGVPASATALRTTNYSHYNQASTASSANVYAQRVLGTAAPLILNAPRQTTLGSSIVQFSYDSQAFDVAPASGNLTAKRIWNDLDNTWITTSNSFDFNGNLVSTTDGRGKVAQYFYDDATHALPNRVVVDPQNGTSTQTTTTVYDYWTGLVTSITDPNNATSTIDYTNQLLGAIDPFARPGVTIGPLVNAGGINQHRRVTTTYEDHLQRIVVAADLNTENDKLLKTRTTGDMLGRQVLIEQTEDGANYTLYSQQAYAVAGLISFSSSVMRTGTSSNTDSWTRVTNDLLGRVTEVATFGGPSQPPNTGTTATATGTVTTAYNANFTTVTDQAGKVRRSMSDALGRLIRVDEPDASNNLGSTAAPVQPTSYAYDVFGNLTTVTQGSQTRTFTYDSFSLLRTALNPESGTTSYKYDANGNLLVKTDSRGVSTHFDFDALNRLTRRWYNASNLISDTTHNVPALPAGVGATDEDKFYYDTQALPTGAPAFSRGAAVGRLVAQTYGPGTNGDYYAFDALGRATLKFQQTGSINYQMSAAYALSGALTTLTYPSNRSVTNSFDQAGRLTALSGNLGDNTTRTYASGILYSPTGSMVKEQFGTTTPIYNKLFYNSRAQLAEIRVSTSYTGPTDTNWNRGAIINSYSDQCSGTCPGSSMTDNNGNLKRQEIYIPNDDQISGYTLRSQQFDFDTLNRLSSAREILNGTEQWKQLFSYDRFGNRTINTGGSYGSGINNKALTVDTSKNRISVPAGQSGSINYDLTGNVTNDTYTGGGNRTFDGENKIVSAVGLNNQVQSYSYNSSGERVKRTVNGAETWQVYGFQGELLAEYPANGPTSTPSKENVYRNWELLVTLDAPAPGPNGYSYRRAVTIDHNKVPNTDQTNFPILISGTYSYLATTTNGGNVQNANGFDVIFTSDVNCATKLSHEVESYSATSGAVNYWIKVPLLSHTTDTTIYLCYGNAGVTTDQSTKTAVWDANYKGVWHLANGSTLNATDSTASSNNGTISGAVAAAGRTGGGASLNGSSNHVEVKAGKVDTSASAGTVSAWVKVSALDANGVVLGYGGAVSTDPALWGVYIREVSGNYYFAMSARRTNGGPYNTVRGSTAVASGTWYYVTYSSNGSAWKIRVNGAAAETLSNVLGTNTGDWIGDISPTTPDKSDIGGVYAGGSYSSVNFWHGILDEVRLSNVERSNDWVATEFNNQNSPATFYSVSSATNLTVLSQINWLVTDHLGTPRMIIDQSGNLATVRRHDYLPFGEELFAGVSGRNSAQGYSGADGVRQQFTQQERDVETGLDLFEARYYTSSQGRFTSADPGPFTPADPQNFNRYSYVQNNPLKFRDPTGRNIELRGAGAQSLIDYIERKTGLKLKYKTKNGVITITGAEANKDFKGDVNKEFAKVVKKVAGAEETAKFNVDSNITNEQGEIVFMDDNETAWNSKDKRPGNVNMTSVQSLDSQTPELGMALVGHFLIEGLEMRKTGSNYYDGNTPGAHTIAKEAERKILSEALGSQQATRYQPIIDGGYRSGVPITFVYTTVQYDITIKNEGGASVNKISPPAVQRPKK
jgi:RHS repeat-associated protein